jgi:hypothetical protein
MKEAEYKRFRETSPERAFYGDFTTKKQETEGIIATPEKIENLAGKTRYDGYSFQPSKKNLMMIDEFLNEQKLRLWR